MSEEHEEWRPVAGYEGFYSVSDLGRVRSEERVVPHGSSQRRLSEKILSPFLVSSGIPWVRLSRGRGAWENFSVHKLVARAFLGPAPSGHRLRPGDGDWTNARLDNLSYKPTRREALTARARTSMLQRRAASDSLDEEIRALLRETRMTGREIADALGVDRSRVSRVKRTQKSGARTPPIEGSVSASEAARQIGCTAQRVAKLCRAGKVPGAKKEGAGRGTWQVPVEQIEPLRASLRPRRIHQDSSNRGSSARILWTLRLLAENPDGISKRRLGREVEMRFGGELTPWAIRSYLNALQDAGFVIRDYERGRREFCVLLSSPFGLRKTEAH